MDAEFAQQVAREVMRQLRYYGNFDEFEDRQEPDGLNAGAADIIANGLMGAYDKRVEVRMKDARKAGSTTGK